MLISHLRQLGLGYAEFEENIELCIQWLLRNRFAEDHPDPNLRGAVVETKVRLKKGKAVIFNRDVETSFAVRIFADYYDYLKK
jgi:hypothetical protein